MGRHPYYFPVRSELKEDFANLAKIWLERSQNRLWSISVFGGLKVDENIVSIICKHGQRLKHLEISKVVHEDEMEAELEDEDGPYPGSPWGGRSSGPLPSLATLTIRGGLLRLAPNLEQFLFPFQRTVGAVHATENLVLSKLIRLMFGQPGTCPGFGDRLINGLSLPGLEALSTSPMPVMTGRGNVISFLMRSSPAHPS
ncbi:hypothetical protein DFH08DRAFT_52919 [Mycena albidolilacea]|uniref:Uncharacterized protein n=1 Tax=Mycena albidolilacea TaxID=1033008 RepID=A0AAD7E926_9AGAR|nr:hypothetical protein DFH08DRAFT_52919 [Mycena albidolilacea]